MARYGTEYATQLYRLLEKFVGREWDTAYHAGIALTCLCILFTYSYK